MPGDGPGDLGHIKFFFLKSHGVSAVRFGGDARFVGTDLGREPVPDLLMIAM
jgi:hypothetical protein